MRKGEKLRVFNTMKFDGKNLVNVKLIKAKELITPMNPLRRIYEEYFWCDRFPTISEHDNEEVIKNFLAMVREETGVKIDRSMVVEAPDWDVFNNPKEKARTKTKKKKAVVFEEPDEAVEAEDDDQGNNDGKDSVDKLVDNPENQQDIEKDEAGETFEMREASAAAKEKTDNVEKGKRTKKRNERPPSSEEGKTARVTKKLKTTTSRPSEKAAGTPKGNVSEPNVDSNSKAQNLPPPSSTIDVTKHISMNLPD
jgi:hypothetical protein